MRLPPSPRPPSGRGGGVTPLAVLSLGLLLGVVALAVDGGTLLEARRHAQAAADAAALAAAADLLANYAANGGADPKGTAQASALATAAANGFANDGANSVVTVTLSGGAYQSGPNAGKPVPAGYAEVVVQYNVGRLFSGVFGAGTTAVRARAVARGQWLPVSNNVIALNPSAPNALMTTGNGSLRVNGGLQVNSNSPFAVNLSGNGFLSASSVTLNQGSGGSLLSRLLSYFQSFSGSQTTVTSSGAVPDPLRFLPAPDPVQLGLSLQGTNLRVSSGTVNLYPGVYNGGISVSGSATVTLHANADGTPGIYYLDGGGFTTSSFASVVTAANESAGVMIYNDWQTTNDAIHLSGQGQLTFVPPASGTYQGVSIFQKRGAPGNFGPNVDITGVGNVNVTGTIYAAYAGVQLAGQSGTNVMGGQVVADTLSITGQASVTVAPGSNPVAHTRVLGLVE